ncbi:ISL3 family transposase [Carnobacterium sp.]|uniref:ISL3 family transposase n=1 Tax=Carnobacterium sp. TaxID=48221 RepID=UPI0028A95C84|nr:ISL3 family transposase [Carnobacterium sp.]
MAFEYIDAKEGKILDILPSRDSRTIKKHFISRYSLKSRNKVETVTVDMNAGYVTIIPMLFPNANIIFDRFHIVQLINRSLNRTRITVMNRLHISNGEEMKKYRRLKRFWKKILKKESELSYTTYNYYTMFGLRLESAIVDELLSYDVTLRETYEIYQALLKAMEKNDYHEMANLLEKDHPLISRPMKTNLKTLRTHLKHIENMFIYPYTNGKIEGINNKIKVLNRVAYGYRSFMNYKNRILLHFNQKPQIEQKEKALLMAA